MTPITDDQIDAVLAAHELDNPEDQTALYARIHERKHKLAHAAAKATQPYLGLAGTPAHTDLLAKLKEAWDAPLTADERDATPGDIEYLTLTVQDCIDAGDAEDAIFASLRLSRKLLGRNPHLWRAQDAS
jgi:hypothetical protein